MSDARPSVLIVDDERTNIDLMVELLKPHYRTLVATSGEKALERAAGQPRPDLVLLDVMMPGMDGYEVCRRLKADEATRGIPVIFVTAMNEVGDETKGFALGAADYITKPVSPPILEARVRAHLENKQARDFIEDRNRVLEGMVQERTRELSRLLEEVSRIKDYNDAILESMSNGVVTVGAAGTIVKVNMAASFLLGAEPDALVGSAASQYFAGKNAWVLEAIAAVQATGSPRVLMDADLFVAGGASASVNVSAVPLKEKDAQVGCMLVIEDLTREKRLKSTMARYMSVELSEKLLAEGEEALGGKVQHASVLFTDIRSFTSISERIGAQETVKLLNEYFGIMVDVVLENGGILDKYIGDAIMAVFGAPFPHPEDADHAVHAAIGMTQALADFNARRETAGEEPIRMGLGINTDAVLSGNIGSLKRMDYTVIGDGVNLASRLESANKLYHTEILISEFTARELKGRYRLREVDVIRVKGKAQPVGVHEVLDHLEDSLPRLGDLLDAHAAGLALYRKQDWKAARDAFERALEVRPEDGPARLYRERCAWFIEHPPQPGWDGVWVMKEK